MAYTATVTKASVIQQTDDDYIVSINVVVNDGASDVFDMEFSERYYNQLLIGNVQAALQDQIKIEWDKYIAEKAIFNAAAFDDMAEGIESALDTYTNL